MDPPFSGPTVCQNLTIYEKREVVWQMAKWPEVAPEKLQSWRRRDLLEILCAETGKERKYTGLSKRKLIENLFKIVLEKKSGKHVQFPESTSHQPQSKSQTPTKRQRKNSQPSQLLISVNNSQILDDNKAPKSTVICKNVACRATLSPEDHFCKRCSCCICYKYDDDKDPSLWLFCSSENLDRSDSCGRSCHVDCALKDERTGIGSNGKCSQLDWSYYCVHCGRVNDLLRCWRKQLTIAEEARKVDVLCHRVSLSHKLFSSQKRQDLHEILDEIIKKLEAELGPLNGLSSMGRLIVSRLSVGDQVRRLCARAIDSVDSIPSRSSSAKPQLQKASSIPSGFIRFKEKSSSSLLVVFNFEDDSSSFSEELIGFTMWHRKFDAIDYSVEPTATLYKPNGRFLVTELIPCTEYIFKVVGFTETRELGMWEVGVTTDQISLTREMSPKTNSSDFSNNILLADLNKPPGSYFSLEKKPVIIESDKSYEQMDREETPSLSGSALDEEPNSMPTNSIDPNRSFEIEDESENPVGNENLEVIGSDKSCVQMEHEESPLLSESNLDMECNSTSNRMSHPWSKNSTEQNQSPKISNSCLSNSTGLCADLNKPPGSYFSYEDNLEVKDLNEICVQMDYEKPNYPPKLATHPCLAKSTESNQPLVNEYKFDPSTLNEKPEVVDSNKSCDQLDHRETPRLSRTTSDTEPNSTSYPDSDRNQPLQIGLEPQAVNETVIIPSLPAKSGITLLLKEAPRKPEREPGSSPEKRRVKSEEDYEYCVKVIRWLECKGHIESSFRVKLLTWLSLRATPQERRVVSIFIDTLVDDPGSLAGQLVDSFSDSIFSKKPTTGMNNSLVMRLQN